MSGAADLVAHARRTRVTVIGGGLAGLVAALECAKVGMPVTVVEASDRLGGCVAAAELDGRMLDVAADGFATSGGHVRALVDELGLGGSVVAPLPGGRWIAGLPASSAHDGDAAPLPEGTVLGIPANPWAEDVRRFIGWRGAWRAYLDRLRPPLTIGHERRLGTLVRTRMGERVLDTMVAPVTRGLFGIEPDDIDVDAAAPGLNAALTRTGSLSGAVAQVLSEGQTRSEGRTERVSLEGGMRRLVDALERQLTDLGVDLRTGFRVSTARRDDSGWTVSREPMRDEASTGAAETPHPGSTDAEAGDTLTSDIVIVATDEAAARRLLEPVVVLPAAAPPASIDVVTLVVAEPALDARPRGHAVFPTGNAATRPATAAESSAATNLTIGPIATGLVHATATWAWLADGDPGTHVLRLMFSAETTTGLSDADAVAAAVDEASALLGIALRPSQVRATHHARYPLAPPVSALGHRELAATVRAAVRGVPGLAVTGAWVGGSGLARVVADATAEADRVRGVALWGSAHDDGE